MSLNEYLAKAYGPAKPKKEKTKRKKKERDVPSTRVIEASTVIGISDENPPLRDTNKVVQSRTERTSKWKNLKTNELVNSLKGNVLHVDKEPANRPHTSKNQIASSTGGLQTAEEAAQRMKEVEEINRKEATASAANTKTTYRDSKGRKIENYEEFIRSKEEDTALREQQRKQEIRDLNMGEYQMLQAQGKLPRPNSEETLSFEDPIQIFKPSNDDTNVKTSILGRKIYQKVYPENRFGIAPGWRWDGVDRSNGFEKKWFAKQNEINETKIKSYTLKEEY